MNEQNIGSLVVSLGADTHGLEHGIDVGSAALKKFVSIVSDVNPLLIAVGVGVAGFAFAFKDLTAYTETYEGALSNSGTQLTAFKLSIDNFFTSLQEQRGEALANEGPMGWIREAGSQFLKFASGGTAAFAAWYEKISDIVGKSEEQAEIQSKIIENEIMSLVPLAEIRNRETELSLIFRDRLEDMDKRSMAYDEFKTKIIEERDLQLKLNKEQEDALLQIANIRKLTIPEEEKLQQLYANEYNIKGQANLQLQAALRMTKDIRTEQEAINKQAETSWLMQNSPSLSGRSLFGGGEYNSVKNPFENMVGQVGPGKGKEKTPLVMLDSFSEKLKEAQKDSDKWQQSFTSNLVTVGNALAGFIEGFAGAFTKGQNILEQFWNYFKKWVISMLAEIAALVVASVVLLLVLPGADVTKIMDAGKYATKFGTIFGKLSSGSLIGSVTDLGGLSHTADLGGLSHTTQSISQGNNLQLSGVVQGQNIIISSNAATKYMDRVT